MASTAQRLVDFADPGGATTSFLDSVFDHTALNITACAGVCLQYNAQYNPHTGRIEHNTNYGGGLALGGNVGLNYVNTPLRNWPAKAQLCAGLDKGGGPQGCISGNNYSIGLSAGLFAGIYVVGNGDSAELRFGRIAGLLGLLCDPFGGGATGG